VIQSDAVGVPSVWKRGLRGEGEIVVVGDTGLDHDHCMFNDPLRPIPFDKVDMKHRKVILYRNAWKNSDNGDHRDGHGTHTAGSLCGETLSSDKQTQTALSAYNGMAFKAKLVVVDFQSTSVRSITRFFFFL
jgi:hypothetical protein